MLGIEASGQQDNLLAVELAVALANRHRPLPRVVPRGREETGFGIEAGRWTLLFAYISALA
jgi:hypothetical protein